MADEEEYVYSDDEYQYDDGPSSPAAVRSPGTSGGAGAATASAARSSSAVASSSTGGNGGSGAAGHAEYRLLREDEILSEQQRVIAEVASILEIPPECANTLLIHFKWAKDALFDKYYADPKTVRAEAGIQHLGVASRPSGPFMCEVCLSECPASEGFGLGCKHVFCKGCWDGYLTAAVTDQGPNCIFTKCMASDCGEAVTRSVVTAMAPREVADKWLQFELKHFVSISKNMTWCPAPGCSNAFVARVPVKVAKCTCGMKFCFRCGKEAHTPVNCDTLDKWLQKCGNESETANWILSNTKKCPQCSVRIEKNQGCNHIVCRNKGCKYEFCWICTGPWAEHGQSTGGYYKCNKYRSSETAETAAPGAGGAEARAKAELDKYLFFFQRYNNHDAAGRFAAKHRETTQKRMAELQSTAVTSWADVGFLESATEALLECRRVLKYTYVLGYYMAEGSEKRLFEHLQEQLERSTEHLAELTEAPLEKMERSEVVNFTRVTLQFLRNLIDGLDEGLTA